LAAGDVARSPPPAYGLAHAGKSRFFDVGELYFAFFLTEVCGRPTAPRSNADRPPQRLFLSIMVAAPMLEGLAALGMRRGADG